jgi:stress-induced morphogen
MLVARVRMTSKPIFAAITEKLYSELCPVSLVVTDESHKHRGHAEVAGSAATETHFDIQVVSNKFVGLNRVQRQRLVNDLLKQEFEIGLHAVSMSCKTADEHDVVSTMSI